LCVEDSVSSLHLFVEQSAGTFDDVAKPTSAYQKTKPVEAGEQSSSSLSSSSAAAVELAL